MVGMRGLIANLPIITADDLPHGGRQSGDRESLYSVTRIPMKRFASTDWGKRNSAQPYSYAFEIASNRGHTWPAVGGQVTTFASPAKYPQFDGRRWKVNHPLGEPTFPPQNRNQRRMAVKWGLGIATRFLTHAVATDVYPNFRQRVSGHQQIH